MSDQHPEDVLPTCESCGSVIRVVVGGIVENHVEGRTRDTTWWPFADNSESYERVEHEMYRTYACDCTVPSDGELPACWPVTVRYE